jgi:putative PIN family toxin of toxin-antitoxin system
MRIVSELRRLAELVDAPPLPAPVSRDPDDDAVLALAVAAQADLIISGDADLLALAGHAGIPIVDAAAAIAQLDT